MLTQTTSIERDTKIAGLLYILLIPLGVMGILYIPDILLIHPTAVENFQTLQMHGDMLRFSIFSALLIQVVQIPLAYYLYKILRAVDEFTARLIIIFVAFAVPIALVNELFNVAALLLVSEPSVLSYFTNEQQAQLLAALLSLHEAGIMIAHIFWGFWLMPMGYLIFRSTYLPTWIGHLLMLAGVGYLLDTVIWILLPDIQPMVADYTFVGEVVLPLWLLFKGVNINAYNSANYDT